MDIVRRIMTSPIAPDAGPFKGQTLAQPVKIVTARRVP